MLHDPSTTRMIFGETRAAVMRPFAQDPSKNMPDPAVPFPPFEPAMAVGLSKSVLGRLSMTFRSSEHAQRNASHSTSSCLRLCRSLMIASLRYMRALHVSPPAAHKRLSYVGLWACAVSLLACATTPPASRSLNPRADLQLANAPEPH